MKLLITGGAGFIGSNYVRWVLANTADEVTVYDALTYAGNLASLRDVEESFGSRYRFVHANICDLPALEEAVAGHDAMVHFAAESHVDRSIAGPEDFALTNCVGTNLVMHAARRAGVERVVHISTDEVYGSVEQGASGEPDRLEPRSPYSASKAGSDLIALSYHSTYGLPVLVTRASNNFGPWQFPEKVIPLFLTNLLDGLNVPLYGDGLNKREWLFVEDHCAAIDAVLRRAKKGEIYNIGAGNEPYQPGPDRQIAGPGRRRAGPDRLCDGPVGPRPPLLHRLVQGARPRVGARARTGRGPEPDVCLVQGQPLVVGAIEKERAV